MRRKLCSRVCAPNQRGPRPPACTLWHETESELPNSVHERALSSGVLCQQSSERMHTTGETTPQITIRNEATALISLAEDLPDGLA